MFDLIAIAHAATSTASTTLQLFTAIASTTGSLITDTQYFFWVPLVLLLVIIFATMIIRAITRGARTVLGRKR